MGMKGMVQSALFVEVEVSGRFRHHNLLVMDIFFNRRITNKDDLEIACLEEFESGEMDIFPLDFVHGVMRRAEDGEGHYQDLLYSVMMMEKSI
jgi:hypothetical protein